MDADVSVVIPSLEGDPLTLESVPDGVEVEVVVGERRPAARNLGVERTSGDVVVFCDDDIRFSEPFFREQIERTPEGVLTGLEDWDFGWLITRFMVVHRSDFERIGGFDERINYMEDTEFCLKALRNGMELRSVSRDEVYHEPHESVGKSRWVLAKNTLYLSLKYPEHAPTLVRGMAL
jgi:GT2 family glycosyltransferase